MKTKMLLVALVVALTTMGFECINDPIIVAVKLGAVGGCWKVNIGNGSFNDQSNPLVLADFVDPSYKDKIEKLRLNDIIVRVTGPHPTGVVSGTGFFRLDSGPEYTLLTFTGQYSAYEGGVSLLNPGTLVTYNPVGLAALIAAISDVDHLPETIILRGAGGGPAVTQNFNLCCELYFQAEASAK